MAVVHLIFSLALYVLVLVWLKTKSLKKHPPLPPGPPAELLIGHIRSIPPNDEKEMFFYDLGKKYGICIASSNWDRLNVHVKLGGIIHLKLPGKILIVLNDQHIATEILDKRGVIYSGRPRFPLAEMYLTCT